MTRSRVLSAGEIEAPADAIRFLLLPDRQLFARRAQRLQALAAGHPLADYLAFLARLVAAQQVALDCAAEPQLPADREMALCREHGLPPLAPRGWRRDPAWRDGLALILRQLQAAPLPAAAGATVAALLQTPEAALEVKADAVLSGQLDGLAPAELPLVAAALQVYWLNLAAALDETAQARLPEAGLCPVCGSAPVAGIIRATGREQGLRYLSCGLCGSQWHKVRLTCSCCDATAGIGHFVLDGGDGAVKAESCAGCGSYLKLFYLEKDTAMEPAADDLATLALDLLMDREGKVRCGPNLLLHAGGAG